MWFKFSSVQSLSRVRLFETPWTAAQQASLSITNSQSLLQLMSIGSMMPSNHLLLCHPLFKPKSGVSITFLLKILQRLPVVSRGKLESPQRSAPPALWYHSSCRFRMISLFSWSLCTQVPFQHDRSWLPHLIVQPQLYPWTTWPSRIYFSW